MGKQDDDLKDVVNSQPDLLMDEANHGETSEIIEEPDSESCSAKNEDESEDEGESCSDMKNINEEQTVEQTSIPESEAISAQNGVDMELLRKIIQEELSHNVMIPAEQIENEFLAIRKLLQENIDKDKMLEDKEILFQKVYAELKKHENGLERSIMQPFLKAAIGWYERVIEMHRYYDARKPNILRYKKVYCDLLHEFECLGDLILDSLENYDVEISFPETGTQFDPSLFKAIEVSETSDPEKNNTIDQCVSPGFHYSDGKIIQYAQVSVFRFVNRKDK